MAEAKPKAITGSYCLMTFDAGLKSTLETLAGKDVRLDAFTKKELNRLGNTLREQLKASADFDPQSKMVAAEARDAYIKNSLVDILHNRARLIEAQAAASRATDGVKHIHQIKGAVDTVLKPLDNATRMGSHRSGVLMDQAIAKLKGQVPDEIATEAKKMLDDIASNRRTLGEILQAAGSEHVDADALRLVYAGRFGGGVDPKQNSVIQALGSVFLEHKKLVKAYADKLDPVGASRSVDNLGFTVSAHRLENKGRVITGFRGTVDDQADAIVQWFKDRGLFESVEAKGIPEAGVQEYREKLIAAWYKKTIEPAAGSGYVNPRVNLEGKLSLVDSTGAPDFTAIIKLHRAIGDQQSDIALSALNRRERHIINADLYNIMGSSTQEYKSAIQKTMLAGLASGKNRGAALKKATAEELAAKIDKPLKQGFESLKTEAQAQMYDLVKISSSLTSTILTVGSGIRQLLPDRMVTMVAHNMAMGDGAFVAFARSAFDFLRMIKRFAHEGAGQADVRKLVEQEIGQVQMQQHLLMQGLLDTHRFATGRQSWGVRKAQRAAEVVSRWSGADRANKITRTAAAHEVGLRIQTLLDNDWSALDNKAITWLLEEGIDATDWRVMRMVEATKDHSGRKFLLTRDAFDELAKDKAHTETLKKLARPGETVEGTINRVHNKYRVWYEAEMNERVAFLAGRDNLGSNPSGFLHQLWQASGFKFIPINLKQTNAIRRSWNRANGVSQHNLTQWAEFYKMEWWKSAPASAAILAAALQSGLMLTYLRDLSQGHRGRELDKWTALEAVAQSGIGGVATIMMQQWQFNPYGFGLPISGVLKAVTRPTIVTPWDKVVNDKDVDWDRVWNDVRVATAVTRIPFAKIGFDWAFKQLGVAPKEESKGYKGYMKKEGLEYLLD